MNPPDLENMTKAWSKDQKTRRLGFALQTSSQSPSPVFERLRIFGFLGRHTAPKAFPLPLPAGSRISRQNARLRVLSARGRGRRSAQNRRSPWVLPPETELGQHQTKTIMFRAPQPPVGYMWLFVARLDLPFWPLGLLGCLHCWQNVCAFCGSVWSSSKTTAHTLDNCTKTQRAHSGQASPSWRICGGFAVYFEANVVSI